MGKISDTFIDPAIHRRSLNMWATAAEQVHTTNLEELRRQTERAKQLRFYLDRVIDVADQRLDTPPQPVEYLDKPESADWAWRPGAWCTPLRSPAITSGQSPIDIGSDATLFHDCDRPELTLRQIRNQPSHEFAPFGVQMDVSTFNGSFLSLVFDLPEDAVTGLNQTHVIGINALVELEKPIDMFARLNIRHDPNTEQIVRQFPVGVQRTSAQFDLAYAAFNDKKISKAWVDVIFENPAMNQITVRDITLYRHPRARL